VLEKVRQKTPIIIATQTKPNSKYSFSFRVVASFMAVIFVVFALYASISPFINSPSSYSTLSIDINPSVELTINRYEQVVSIEAVNSDANALINSVNLLGDNVELAIEKLLNKAIEQGYLTTENSNALLFSVKNKNQERIDALKLKIENKMDVYLTNRNIPNTILFEAYSEELRQEFDELKEGFNENVNITPAKYRLIKSVLIRFPNLIGHEEYLANMTISELHQLLTAPTSNSSLQDLIDRILENYGNGFGGIGRN